MPVLISDANVIIDMEDGELTRQMFALPYQFLVPDLLFYDELEQHHPELIELGLRLVELVPESMERALQLEQQYRRPSVNDCFALAAAEQEKCPLITCDGPLRKAAQKENVEIRGTLWVVEELVIHGQITKEQASNAFDTMKDSGSRLPWGEVEKLLNRL